MHYGSLFCLTFVACTMLAGGSSAAHCSLCGAGSYSTGLGESVGMLAWFGTAMVYDGALSVDDEGHD